MAFCIKCGIELPSEAEYCNACGAKAESVAGANINQAVLADEQELKSLQLQNERTKRSGYTFLGFILMFIGGLVVGGLPGAIIVVLIGLIIFGIVGIHKNNKLKKQQQQRHEEIKK